MASVQQITYQMIIDYLSPNKNHVNDKETSSFPTKENIVININDFPKKIKRFFNKNFFRYGILCYDENHDNISFYASILSCLDSTFLTMNKKNKLSLINVFKKKLKNDFINEKLFKKYNYSQFNISEKILLNDIEKKTSLIVIQSIIDYLNINIILFNFDDKKRYLLHSKEVFNVYYPTLLLGYSNGYYEPIFTNKKKMFTYNDKIIRKILKNNLIKMSLDDNTEFVTNNDVNLIINEMVDMNKALFNENDDLEEKLEDLEDDDTQISLVESSDNDSSTLISNDDFSVVTDDTQSIVSNINKNLDDKNIEEIEIDDYDDDYDDEDDDDDDEDEDEDDEDDEDLAEQDEDLAEQDEDLAEQEDEDLAEQEDKDLAEQEDENLAEQQDNDKKQFKNIKIDYSKYKKFSKSKWNKMRKDELLDVINNLKLNVGKYQNKKKSDVITDIIKTISS